MFEKALESVCVGAHPVGQLATVQVSSEETAVIEIIKCQALKQF